MEEAATATLRRLDRINEDVEALDEKEEYLREWFEGTFRHGTCNAVSEAAETSFTGDAELKLLETAETEKLTERKLAARSIEWIAFYPKVNSRTTKN